METAHFDAADGAYSCVQNCEENTSKVPASLRAAAALRIDLMVVGSDDWYDSDDVYVDYYADGYYLYNRRYPVDRVAISFYLN